MNISNLATLFITGGVGAALGSVFTAIVEVVSKRGESRASAADLVARAAGNLADRLDRINDNLDKENMQMRSAIIAFTDTIEELVPLLPNELSRVKATQALKASRLALR